MTICTKGRAYFFGEIQDGIMCLSAYGSLAYQYWQEIPQHFSKIVLDVFVVMPNHVHGILWIRRPDFVGNADLRSLQNQSAADGIDVPVGVADLQPLRGQYPDISDRTKMTLSKVIHGFKSSVTRTIRKDHDDLSFAWQRSFYDHIIRDEEELNRIRQYILENPKHWKTDKFYNE